MTGPDGLGVGERPGQLILDSSLFVARSGLDGLAANLQGRGGEAFVSKALRDAALSGKGWEDIVAFHSPFPGSRASADGLLDLARPLLRGFPAYGWREEHPLDARLRRWPAMAQRLADRAEGPLAEVLMDEFTFLQSRSFWGGRGRRTLEAWIEAGAAALQVGLSSLDPVLRPVLQRSHEGMPAEMTWRHRGRAVLKYGAIAGPEVAAQYGAHLLGLGLVSAFFLYWDP